MAVQELSDADVFGTAAPAAPQAAQGELSDADVFGAPAAAARPGLGERLFEHVRHGFDNSLAGAATRFLGAYTPNDPAVMGAPQIEPAPSIDEAHAAINAQRTKDMAGYEAMPPAEGVAERGAAVLGELFGAAPSPENFVAPELRVVRGAAEPAVSYLARKLGAGAVTQAPVAAVGNVGTQALDIAGGAQDHFDPLETAIQATVGGGIGGALHIAPDALKMLYGKGREILSRLRGSPADLSSATPEEVAAVLKDPDLRAMLDANGVTSPTDPRAPVLEQRLADRRAAEAESSARPINTDKLQVRDEKDAIEAGTLDPAAASAVNAQRAPVPDVIVPNAPQEPGLAAGAELRGKFNAPAVVGEPRPAAMTPDEIATAQRRAAAGKPAGPEGDTLAAPPDRAPQTRDDIAAQRQAGQAFDLADRQRDRAGPGVADTQPAGRPEGFNAQDVHLDDGHPVEVLGRRMVPDGRGNMVEVAKVRRYDPRTGEPAADAVEYEVPTRQLRKSTYAQEPRAAQDFRDRAESPAGEKLGLDEQTYRTTEPDPNERFPGAAGEGRSPFPDQPPGEAPGQRWSSYEEAVRDFQERQARGEQRRASEGARARAQDQATSSKAKGQDRDGAWSVDEDGHVVSDKGGAVRFGDQKQAARWILNVGQKDNKAGQFFEIANHPSGRGFTVRERGRTGPEGGGGGNAAPNGASTAPAGERPASTGGALPRPSEPQARPAAARSTPLYERPPGKPRSLFGWIRDNGGLKDQDPAMRGEVANSMGLSKGRSAGLINNKNGMSIDDAALKAWQEGYFPDHQERPTMRDFAEAVDREARGEPVYAKQDEAAAAARSDALGRNAELDELTNRLGIETEGKSREQVADEIADRMSVEDMARELDDRAAALEDDFAQAEAGARDWVESRGDAWEPDAFYDSGEPRTLGDLENADASEFRPESHSGQTGQGGQRDRAEPGPAGAGEEAVSAGDRPSGRDAGPARRGASEGQQAGEAAADRPGAIDITDQGEQRVIPGAERRAAPPASDRGLTSDKAQKPAGSDGGLFDSGEGKQGDLLDRQEAGARGLGAKLYSGVPLDAIGRSVADTIARIWQLSKEEVSAWADGVERFAKAMTPTGKSGAGSALVNMAKALTYSNDGFIRGLGWKYRKNGEARAVLNEIADLFFAPVGDRTRKAVGETYEAAMVDKATGYMNRLSRALEPFRKLRAGEQEAVLSQIGNLLTSGKMTAGTAAHDAAIAIRGILKELHVYQKEAGVELGEVKNGYLPRVENTDEILRNTDAFKADVTRYLMKQGATREAAEASAAAWLERVMTGDLGVTLHNTDFVRINAASGAPQHTKGRILGKDADTALARWYLRNPAEIIPQYILRASRRAEWTRRMGPDLANWAAYKRRLIDAGAGEAIPEVVRAIESATGMMGNRATGGLRSLGAGARAWSSLAFLPRAVYSSLSEPFLAAIRTGNVADALKSYGLSLSQWTVGVRNLKSLQAQRHMAEDLGLIGTAMDDLIVQQFTHGLQTGRIAKTLEAGFYRKTGLHSYTEATRIASMKIGQVFLRRLANDVAGEGKIAGVVPVGKTFQDSAKILMRELGIPDEKQGAFAAWVRAHEGKVGASDALDGSEHGTLYRGALSRFVDQTILRPTGASRARYANHPLGGLLYSLQSYNYAFQKNVLNRVYNTALTAVTREGLNPIERAQLLAPLGLMPVLYGINYALGEVRDVIFQDPARKDKPMTVAAKLGRAVSRTGLTGSFDLPYNVATGLRYQKDPATTMLGPLFGGFSEALSSGVALTGDRNSDNTNTAERKAGRAAYNMFVQPALNAAMASTPGKIGFGIGALGIQAASHPAAREYMLGGLLGPPVPAKPGKNADPRAVVRSVSRPVSRGAVDRTVKR